MTHQKQEITCGKFKYRSVFDLAEKIQRTAYMLCVHTYMIMYKSWLGILMSNVKSRASVCWISTKEEQQEDEKLFLIK